MCLQQDACDPYCMLTSLQTLQAEVRKKMLQFKEQDFTWRGKPNESLGVGSLGQLAGGNEMKQSGVEKKKRKKTGWQCGDVTSGPN